jgi:hypothetical protein
MRTGKDGHIAPEQAKQLAQRMFPDAFHRRTGQSVDAVLGTSAQYTTFRSLVQRAGLTPLLRGEVVDSAYTPVTFAEAEFEKEHYVSSGDIPDVKSPSGGRPVGTNMTQLKGSIMDIVNGTITDAAKYAAAQEGQITVFAPTNAAFDKLPAAIRTALTRDSATAAAFVRAYITNRGVYTPGFSKVTSLTSLAETPLELGRSTSGAATVNGVAIVGSELVGDNGVVHGLAEILPSTLPITSNGSPARP